MNQVMFNGDLIYGKCWSYLW